jgi:hypothetical protein
MANQALIQMGAMVMNPAFGINPAKYAEEMLRAQKIDPKRLQFTDEEKEKMAQQPPPTPPQIEAAKIRAEVEMKKLEVTNQTKQIEIKTDTDRDTQWVRAETERTRAQHDAKMQELTIKRELAMLEYANEQKMSLESIKAQLAAKAADINLERELAATSHMVDMDKHRNPQPPLEPAGKAPNGQAWAQ